MDKVEYLEDRITIKHIYGPKISFNFVSHLDCNYCSNINSHEFKQMYTDINNDNIPQLGLDNVENNTSELWCNETGGAVSFALTLKKEELFKFIELAISKNDNINYNTSWIIA